MIGEVADWDCGRNSGRVRPVGEPEHPGLYCHGAAFGNTAPVVGTRVVYTAWTSRSGIDMAVNVRLATAEQVEVARCLG